MFFYGHIHINVISIMAWQPHVCTYHTTHNIHHLTPPPSCQPLRTSHHINPYRPQPSSIHTLPFPILPQSTIATMTHCPFCGRNLFSLPLILDMVALHYNISPKSRFQSICPGGHWWPLEKEAVTNAG